MFEGFFTYARQVKSFCLFSLSPAHLLRLAKACLGCAAAQLAKACHKEDTELSMIEAKNTVRILAMRKVNIIVSVVEQNK